MKFHGSLFLEKYAPGFRCSMPWLKITNYVRFQFQLLQIYGKSYTRELCLKKWMKGILAVMSTTQLVLKIKPEKKFCGDRRIEDWGSHSWFQFQWQILPCELNLSLEDTKLSEKLPVQKTIQHQQIELFGKKRKLIFLFS